MFQLILKRHSHNEVRIPLISTRDNPQHFPFQWHSISLFICIISSINSISNAQNWVLDFVDCLQWIEHTFEKISFIIGVLSDSLRAQLQVCDHHLLGRPFHEKLNWIHRLPNICTELHVSLNLFVAPQLNAIRVYKAPKWCVPYPKKLIDSIYQIKSSGS